MTWNYRIVKDQHGYTIRDVYYNQDGLPYLWSAEPEEPFGETPLELAGAFSLMKTAFDKPILEIRNGEIVEV